MHASQSSGAHWNTQRGIDKLAPKKIEYEVEERSITGPRLLCDLKSTCLYSRIPLLDALPPYRSVPVSGEPMASRSEMRNDRVVSRKKLLGLLG